MLYILYYYRTYSIMSCVRMREIDNHEYMYVYVYICTRIRLYTYLYIHIMYIYIYIHIMSYILHCYRAYSIMSCVRMKDEQSISLLLFHTLSYAHI